MSGSLSIEFRPDITGPLADGTASEVMARAEKAIRQAVADRGAELLRAFPMDKTGRARGGFQENLQVVDKGSYTAVPGPQIRGVTWASWLEGSSDRNSSTGFRGYRLFRKTKQQLDNGEAVQIGDRVLAGYLPELGGE